MASTSDEDDRNSVSHSVEGSIRSPQQVSRTGVTPLPKLQITLALLIKASEPITAEVIYPFIPEFIRRTGITRGDESRTGYYAGIIESLFFFSESLVVTQWGRASDAYGRRPVLLIGPLGLSFAMIGFGLSKNFWSLVVFRSAQGIMNGNLGVVKTILGELSDDTNRADAFALISVAWTFGATLGPTLGGLLANPATRWPDTFGKFHFFFEYPYFLPCAATGLFSFVCFVLAFLGLKETHPLYKAKPPQEDENQGLLSEDTLNGGSYGTISHDVPNPEGNAVQAQTAPQQPSYRSLLTPGLSATLACQAFLALTDMCYAVLIPLIYSTSTYLGGLGFSPFYIGTILAITMFVNAMNQVTLSKWLLKKIGARNMFIFTYSTFVGDFIALMSLRMLVHHYGRVTTAVWIVIVLQQICALGISAAYTAMSVLVVENAPNGTLGTVNGLAQMISAGTRAVGPAFASSLFALSLQSGLLGGYLVDCVLLSVVVVGIWCALRLPPSA
ncbi:hypothetical protein V5O48_016890 [Marasmius crinis-equi]|uniref:Major facilitator superfamily (MFS) profile domain-containing protein n=1 Tax=Marasmius crinis-equi TaxID=585013 RepID=A0ABR3EQH2_9AGAR